MYFRRPQIKGAIAPTRTLCLWLVSLICWKGWKISQKFVVENRVNNFYYSNWHIKKIIMNTVNDQSNPQQNPQHPTMNYQFSKEELQVFSECNSESFFQRSLPLGSALGIAAWYAVQNGYLKGSPKFGATPKVLLGITIGYFAGKLSYQNKCAEKIMKLPNSRFAELLRQRKRGGGIIENLTPNEGFGAGLSLSPFSSGMDHYSDEVYKKSDALDLDTYKPNYAELDDNARPSIDRQTYLDEDLQLPLEPPKSSVTYDELRKQNREEYSKRQQSQVYKPLPRDEGQAIIRAPEKSKDENPIYHSPPSGNKNAYGDTWSQ